MKRHVLDASFELNCQVFGLISPKSFLELACGLKNDIDINFERSKDIQWTESNVLHSAPSYTFVDDQIETTYVLIRNKGEVGWIAKEYKNVDAFLIETNYNGLFRLRPELISKSKLIQFCFDIEVTTLKKTSQQRLDIN